MEGLLPMDFIAAKVFFKEKKVILNDFMKENIHETYNCCKPRKRLKKNSVIGYFYKEYWLKQRDRSIINFTYGHGTHA